MSDSIIQDHEEEEEEEEEDDFEFDEEKENVPHISALEKYGYLTPEVLRLLEDHESNDDDLADDDNGQDVDTDETNKESDSPVDTETELKHQQPTENEDDIPSANLEVEVDENELKESSEEDDYDPDADYFYKEEDQDELSVSSNWTDDEGIVEIDKVFEEEEEDDEREAIDESKVRRIEFLQDQKDSLINQYLLFMKHLKKLRKHNVYIQDYLYKLCIKKKLIFEVDSDTKDISAAKNNRAISKAKRQKKKLDARMAENFEAFAGFKLHHVTTPKMKDKHVDAKKKYNRSRRMVVGIPIAPDYKSKIDKRVVLINGIHYKRELKSQTRNWKERAVTDEAKLAILQSKKKEKALNLNEPLRVQHGYQGAPKQRTLIEVLTAKKKKRHRDSNPKALTEEITEREIKLVINNHEQETVKKSCEGKDCQTDTTTNYNKYVSQHQNSMEMDDNKPKNFTKKKDDKVQYVNLKPNNKDINSGENVLRHDNFKTKAGRKIFGLGNCHKKKKFLQLQWFDNKDQLKGRKYSGNLLLSAEKQDLINFVDSALLNLPQRKKAQKIKLKRQKENLFNDWRNAVERLQQLIMKNNSLEIEHKKNMKEKFVLWGLWEKRNSVCVECLRILFSEFLQQPYFSKGKLRTFDKDVQEFENDLNSKQENLMRQLIKMYNSRMSLYMIQRKLKDTTNQTLVQLGFSISDYEAFCNDNNTMYQKLLTKEEQMQKERLILGKLMNSVVSNRNLKTLVKDSVIKAKAKKEKIHEAARTNFENISKAKNVISFINKKFGFLINATSLLRKPNLIRDFVNRNLDLNTLNREQSGLSRNLRLREKELNSIRIKMKSVQIAIKQYTNLNMMRRDNRNLRLHKANMDGDIYGMILNSINQCDIKMSHKKVLTKKPPLP